MKIVVGGVGLVTALGVGVSQNLKLLCEGKSGISAVPKIVQTTHQLPVGELLLTNAELHQLAEVSEREHLSRTALLGILAAKEALRDADVSPSQRVALVSSTSVGGMDLTEHFYAKFLENEKSGRLRDVRMHDCGASTLAIAKHCGITGYTTTISTACSSAANAILFGAKLLRHNVADFVVVGGCDALSAFTLNGFKSLMILDENPCRPFDETRSGLNLGEGAGYLVLQRENEAKKSYCQFAGGANSNDAFHQTASSENGEGAYLAMKQAVANAKIAPTEVDYINAHGTGTKNNDLSESIAIKRFFGEKIPFFSSTKAFTGHTLAAAGGIEAVFSALAIKNGILYPNLNFKTPISETNLVPNTQFLQQQNINCVLSNSFGFGGNCTSVVFKK